MTTETGRLVQLTIGIYDALGDVACDLCGRPVDVSSTAFTVQVKGGRPVCQECVDASPTPFLWGYAEAFDMLDTAAFETPPEQRHVLIDATRQALDMIAKRWTFADESPSERARRAAEEVIAAKVASGELVELEGDKVIEADRYDPAKHGPAAS